MGSMDKKEEIAFIKVRQRGEITIPQPIRKYLEAHPGDHLEFRTEEGKVIMKKVKHD